VKILSISEACVNDSQEIAIRAVSTEDVNLLRMWKNENRAMFFAKDLISVEQQVDWFARYQADPNDLIVIVEYNQIDIGCAGIRKIEAEWDIYNVICGNKAYLKRGLFSFALQRLIVRAKALQDLPVRLKVLKTNPAVKFYRSNGFSIQREISDYYMMEFSE
jgi:ribosomal protein S18 acetylase RimI-like enzyme